MISRVTLFSLLLGLMLAAVIWYWSDGQTDNCARYMAGDKSLPASEWVVSGTRTIEVPCSEWIIRQPMRVQLLCLLDLVLAVVFMLNALMDLRNWLEMRRRRRPMHGSPT